MCAAVHGKVFPDQRKTEVETEIDYEEILLWQTA